MPQARRTAGAGKLRRNVAYEAIRRRILSGEYPPGTTLSEAALGRTFGISRTPVREALMRLQEEGLTAILARRGAIVRILSVQEIQEILIVREALEGAAAALAASRISRGTIAEVRKQWLEYLDTLSEATLGQIDKRGVEFHAIVVEASGNRTLARMLEGIRGRIEGGRQLYIRTSGEAAVRRARVTCEEHLKVLDALETGEPERAEAVMRQHLRQIRAETLGGLE
ncbi:MAG: GntR family transcriptional regulator [Candidatus Rokubacteria bacterium]|nr:GntR family transcriptional regulator [Candidatus Rokubacteria bacterium]